MSSHHLACFVALGLMLTAGNARAEGPPAAPVQAPPPTPAPPPVSAPAPTPAPFPEAPPARVFGAQGGVAPPPSYPSYPAPPGYAPYPAPPGWYPPPGGYGPYTPMKRRSSGMIAAGAILVSLASVGLIAGPAMIVGGQQTVFVDCPLDGGGGGCGAPPPDTGLKVAGITSVVLGVVALGAGIPLLVVGSQKVPDRGDDASLAPTVRVGAGGASVAWRF